MRTKPYIFLGLVIFLSVAASPLRGAELLQNTITSVDEEHWARSLSLNGEVGRIELFESSGRLVAGPIFVSGELTHIPNKSLLHAFAQAFRQLTARDLETLRRVRFQHTHPTLPGAVIRVGEKVVLDESWERRSNFSDGDTRIAVWILRALQNAGLRNLELESHIIFEGRESGNLNKKMYLVSGDLSNHLRARSVAKKCADFLLHPLLHPMDLHPVSVEQVFVDAFGDMVADAKKR